MRNICNNSLAHSTIVCKEARNWLCSRITGTEDCAQTGHACACSDKFGARAFQSCTFYLQIKGTRMCHAYMMMKYTVSGYALQPLDTMLKTRLLL